MSRADRGEGRGGGRARGAGSSTASTAAVVVVSRAGAREWARSWARTLPPHELEGLIERGGLVEALLVARVWLWSGSGGVRGAGGHRRQRLRGAASRSDSHNVWCPGQHQKTCSRVEPGPRIPVVFVRQFI